MEWRIVIGMSSVSESMSVLANLLTAENPGVQIDSPPTRYDSLVLRVETQEEAIDIERRASNAFAQCKFVASITPVDADSCNDAALSY